MFIGVPQDLFNYLHVLLVIRSGLYEWTYQAVFAVLLFSILCLLFISTTVCGARLCETCARIMEKISHELLMQ